jgi:hypothetical protein
MSDDAGIGREEAERLATALAARRPDAADAAAVSRWMLGALSLVHAPVYRAAEVRDGLAGLGLTDRLACYLAARAAPLGPVGAEVVASCFYGFAPHAVARHVPAVWTVASPELVLAATLAAMRRVLLRVLPGREAEVADAAGLLRSIAEDQEVAGRTLAAAWSAVPWTDDVHVDLWLATTVIRESRGDAHVALLVAEGIGPLESHLLTQGDGAEQRLRLAGMRGWTDAEVDVVAEGLRARGLLAADGGSYGRGASAPGAHRATDRRAVRDGVATSRTSAGRGTHAGRGRTRWTHVGLGHTARADHRAGPCDRGPGGARLTREHSRFDRVQAASVGSASSRSGSHRSSSAGPVPRRTAMARPATVAAPSTAVIRPRPRVRFPTRSAAATPSVPSRAIAAARAVACPLRLAARATTRGGTDRGPDGADDTDEGGRSSDERAAQWCGGPAEVDASCPGP